VTSVTFTAGGTRGGVSITATVTGVSTPATFSETIAGNPAPSMSFSYSPTANPATYGATVTLTSTLTPPSGATTPISGTVTFSDHGTAIQTTNVSNGAATYAYIPLAGNHSYTAVYNGDANYSTASSSIPLALVVAPLSITASASAVTFPFGTLNLPVLTGQLSGVLPADASNVNLSLGTTPAYSNVLPAGVYNISGSITGTAASNYQLTSTTGTVTVTPAPVTIALTASNPYPGTSTQVAFTATVASVVTGAPLSTTTADPAATVTFYDGTTSIGSVKNGSTGIALFNYTFSTLGQHVITAVVTPGNYGPGTSNAVPLTVSAPAVTLSTDLPTYTVIQGQKANITLTTLTVGGFSSPLAYTCSGLPANASCIVTIPTFTPTPTASPAVYGNITTVQIDTAGPGVLNTHLNAPLTPKYGASRIAAAGMLVLPGCLLLSLLSSKRRARVWQMLALALFGLALSQTTGCGGGVANPAQAVYTPVGTSTVMITATSGTLTASTNVTLNVVAAPQ
jgi:hypothetical protein